MFSPLPVHGLSQIATEILAQLRAVDRERQRRVAAPGLDDKVVALKAYQQRRFSHTYADLLRSQRYGAAARFFLDELYGPGDFTRRDGQFARVVPALVRLFPAEIVDTVAALAKLHALSEALDTEMGVQLHDAELDASAYIEAWQRAGSAAQRQSQIELTLDVARRLDLVTRSRLMRGSLRLMRGPAQAANLTELQRFLEAGFDTFRAMKDAGEFIATVDVRERSLARALFDADLQTPGSASLHLALASLPSASCTDGAPGTDRQRSV
jgi:hypothetical protein